MDAGVEYLGVMPAISLGRERPAAAVGGDAAIVARAKEGDEAAFEHLVHTHEAEVYRVCRRMLGSPDAAMDAAQDTFLRAFRSLGRFRGEAAFRTWVYGIALNVCRNVLASRAHRSAARTDSISSPAGERDAPALQLLDLGLDPERAAYGRELGQALETALRSVSPDHREVIILREVQGLEYEEIAAALGCRPGTVKSRLARARAALMTALEGVWP